MSQSYKPERISFETSRELEFFTKKELLLQLGCSIPLWPIAIVKELIDNALDAAEKAGTVPCVEVRFEDDQFSVTDNGPGIPDAVIRRSIDYTTRTSSNALYVSPSRGQLGNAYKCIWAAPFVADGKVGRVMIEANDKTYTVEVRLDEVHQRPNIVLNVTDGPVKTGTSVTVFWPELASRHWNFEGPFFTFAAFFLSKYPIFNPNAKFRVTTPNEEWSTDGRIPVASPKWTAGDATSPWWYSTESLRNLIAGYLRTKPDCTIRQFTASFRGLQGSAKQRAVAESLGDESGRLSDLLVNDEFVDSKIESLRIAMARNSTLVPPEKLGVLGKDAMGQYGESTRYKMAKGFHSDGIPYVLEVSFAICEEGPRSIWTGVNFTPMLQPTPFDELHGILSQARVDDFDPVLVTVHYTSPVVAFIDRGKSRATLPPDVLIELQALVHYVTQDWQKIKRKSDRDGRAKQREIDSSRNQAGRSAMPIKEAAYASMVDAYMKASDNGIYPANARQIMYAARPTILALTGKDSFKDQYFTQTLLPQFIVDFPEITKSWNVAWDDRGHMQEPYTGIRLGLGTLAVDGYVSSWAAPNVAPANDPIYVTDEVVTTKGPDGRFGSILFVEKEGFLPLFEHARLQERFGIAIMSTKGMASTAARRLIEQVSRRGVRIFVLHDFDKAGLSILHTLRNDTDRYQFHSVPNVIDLGLRLSDVIDLELQAEPVSYDSEIDPKLLIREQGGTLAESEFLVSGGHAKNWFGSRVELNAMTGPVLLKWLEGKLQEHGVSKVLPTEDMLKLAYQRIHALQGALAAANNFLIGYRPVPVHLSLMARVEVLMAQNDVAWDEAVATLVNLETQK